MNGYTQWVELGLLRYEYGHSITLCMQQFVDLPDAPPDTAILIALVFRTVPVVFVGPLGATFKY